MAREKQKRFLRPRKRQNPSEAVTSARNCSRPVKAYTFICHTNKANLDKKKAKDQMEQQMATIRINERVERIQLLLPDVEKMVIDNEIWNYLDLAKVRRLIRQNDAFRLSDCFHENKQLFNKLVALRETYNILPKEIRKGIKLINQDLKKMPERERKRWHKHIDEEYIRPCDFQDLEELRKNGGNDLVYADICLYLKYNMLKKYAYTVFIVIIENNMIGIIET